MAPIIRNFLSVIRRYKLAATLNVLGLSVAFAAFMVIMIQLDYDNGFDKFHKDSDRIFRLELTSQTTTQAIVGRPLAERFFDSSPHIVAGTIANQREESVFFHVENNAGRNYFKESSIRVSPEFTDVFTFDLAEGANDALKTPQYALIPLSMSRKLFGKESAIGKQLVFDWGSQTVGAVYRDFPVNSVIGNCIYLSIPADENKQSWQSFNYHAYLRVNQTSDSDMLFENFKRNFDIKAVWGDSFDWDESGLSLRLTALPDIHFASDVRYDHTPKASRQTSLILFAIAIVIVAIATINFTNFSTALTPMRIKSINTQLVLGARRTGLRIALVFEAVIICLLSYLVALLLVYVFRESGLAKLINADLTIVSQPVIYCGTVFVAILAGLLAGVYPARYITSFAPALVLKGSFGLSPKSKKLRNTLIGIQFMASFALIIGALFMYLQNNFMRNSSLGYDKDALITVDIRQIQNSRDAFANQIKSYAGVEDVTWSQYLLSSSDQYWSRGRDYNGTTINYQLLPVHHTFLKVMGIEITEGRDFRQEDTNAPYGVYVFNETAHKQYRLEANTMLEDNSEIIGFVPDIKFASFRSMVEPMAFYVWGAENSTVRLNNACIKVKAGTDLRAAMSHIHSTLAQFDANYPFDVRFYDEVLQRLYEKETALSALISLFSLIAIFIAIVGVFGLVFRS